MAEQGLKEKTVNSVGWTATETILRYGVSFFVGIILARLLTPDEYGLIGILTVFIAFSEEIINCGFVNALIRKQNAQDIDYCTVFHFNFILSVLMAGLLFLSSGIIANFFEREELVLLTKVMSSVLIINALALVQRTRLTKAINFKPLMKIGVASSLISGIVGIVMAYKGYGVWALVGQQLSNAASNTIMLWIVNRWVPKLQFSVKSLKEFWNYGWKLLVSGILNKTSSEIQHLIIGKLFLPATLGQYTRAYQFGNIFSGNMTAVVQKVTFPVLSTIQNEPARMKEAYKRVIKVTVLPTFVFMMGLAAVAKPLLIVLIGVKWTEAAYFLQIISFSLMIYPLNALNLNAIQVLGRSDLSLKINVIKNLLIIIPITIGFFFGIYWMLIAGVVRVFFCYFLNAYYSKPLLDYSITEQLKDIFPSLKIALTMAIPVYLMSFIPVSYYILLPIQLLLGATIAIGVCEKSKLSEYFELKNIVISYSKKLLHKN